METEGFGEPDKYPTTSEVNDRLTHLFVTRQPLAFICYRYQSQKSGKWCPIPKGCEMLDEWSEAWRKPAPGMLLAAMATCGCDPENTLMVGDSEEDQQAAANAGCTFQWAWEFFGRPKSE